MAGWQKILARTVTNAEEHFDLLKFHFRERLGGRNPIIITPYRGFGTQERLYIKGRVLEDRGIDSPMDDDTLWDNLVNMYKRFKSNEIPYARILARLNDIEQEVVADLEGFFEVWIDLDHPLRTDRMWHPVDLELLHPLRPGYPPVHAEGYILVPPESASIGVISDIDDTVLHTDATHLIRMARNVFLGNARTRLPFKGVGAFYRALLRGGQGVAEINPLFYVSSSPWNLYDLLSDFFQMNDIPLGPILFLRDWGVSERELLPITHRSHKLQAIQRILDTYTNLPFVLIGDSGQEDPEIYAEVVDVYPDRIKAIYIRNISRGLNRPEAIQKLAAEVVESGSTLILADDTYPMAEHASSQGWIAPEDLVEIRSAIAADEEPPTLIEQLLGEEEKKVEGPTIVIEEENLDMIEEKLEKDIDEGNAQPDNGGDQEPPTIIVKGD
jgi:phosphatidate phosphatase APP1